MAIEALGAEMPEGELEMEARGSEVFDGIAPTLQVQKRQEEKKRLKEEAD